MQHKIERYRSFLASDQPETLIQVAVAEKGTPVHPKSIAHYDFTEPTDKQAWLDAIIDEVKSDAAAHPCDDDHIPAAKILLGAAISLLIRDRPVSQTGHGATAAHIMERIEDYQDWDFRLDERNRWFQLLQEARRYCEERSEELGFIMPISRAGPLDQAFELRGVELYTDLIDKPEEVVGFLDFITSALIEIAEATRPEIPSLKSDVWGAGWGFNVCLPGYGGVLTADISCQISEEMFREIELPFLKRLADHSPSYLLHAHAAGKHQYSAYASLENVRMLQLVDDPNAEPVIEDLDDILPRVGLKPLLINASPGQIKQHLDTIRHGKIVLRTRTQTEKEANELINTVRGTKG